MLDNSVSPKRSVTVTYASCFTQGLAVPKTLKGISTTEESNYYSCMLCSSYPSFFIHLIARQCYHPLGHTTSITFLYNLLTTSFWITPSMRPHHLGATHPINQSTLNSFTFTWHIKIISYTHHRKFYIGQRFAEHKNPYYRSIITFQYRVSWF